MGCYDTVTFRCPGCGQRFSEQTKAGNCTLSDYEEQRLPLALAANMDGDRVTCPECAEEWRIRARAPVEVAVTLEPLAARLYADD